MLRRLFELWRVSGQVHPDTSGRHIHPEPPSTDAHAVIEQAVAEMNVVIERLRVAKAASEHDKREIESTLHSYTQRGVELHTEAKRLMQAGKEAAARKVLAEKSVADGLVASYQAIAGNIAATLHQLDMQMSRMLVQRDEIKARRSILATQLASATSEQEFLAKIRALTASEESLEHEVNYTRAVLHIAHEASDGRSTAFSALAALDASSEIDAAEQAVTALEAELAREHTAKQQLENESIHKRFQIAFHTVQTSSKAVAGTSTTPPNSVQALHDFFAQAEASSDSSHQMHLSQQTQSQEGMVAGSDAATQNAFANDATNTPASVPQSRTQEQQQMMNEFFKRP
jgi:hypothetical protein